MASRPLICDQLPIQLIVDNLELTIDTLGPDQLSEAYSLVQTAAHQGQNIGQDEFPSEAHLLSHLTRSHTLSLTHPHTRRLKALLTVVPTAYSRMVAPLVASSVIVCEEGDKASLMQALIQVSLDFAKDLGFEGLLVDVFRTSSLQDSFKEEGFSVIGHVPQSGYLTGQGLTDSLIMFRNIQADTSQFLRVGSYRGSEAQSKGKSIGEKYSSRIENRVKSINNMPSLIYLKKKPHRNSLPFQYTFSTGLTACIRYMQELDVPKVYHMFRRAAEQGRGFSTDEFFTLDIFRHCVFEHGHPIVIEEEHTSQIIAVVSIVPSVLCRSVDPMLADPYLVVKQGFQGQGLGMEVSRLMLGFAKDLGYGGVLADYLASNEAVAKMNRHLGFTVAGVIPKGARGKGNMLFDLVLGYKDLGDTCPFGSKL